MKEVVRYTANPRADAVNLVIAGRNWKFDDWNYDSMYGIVWETRAPRKPRVSITYSSTYNLLTLESLACRDRPQGLRRMGAWWTMETFHHPPWLWYGQKGPKSSKEQARPMDRRGRQGVSCQCLLAARVGRQGRRLQICILPGLSEQRWSYSVSPKGPDAFWPSVYADTGRRWTLFYVW